MTTDLPELIMLAIVLLTVATCSAKTAARYEAKLSTYLSQEMEARP